MSLVAFGRQMRKRKVTVCARKRNVVFGLGILGHLLKIKIAL